MRTAFIIIVGVCSVVSWIVFGVIVTRRLLRWSRVPRVGPVEKIEVKRPGKIGGCVPRSGTTWTK